LSTFLIDSKSAFGIGRQARAGCGTLEFKNYGIDGIEEFMDLLIAP
jgi:hypothetical protein